MCMISKYSYMCLCIYVCIDIDTDTYRVCAYMYTYICATVVKYIHIFQVNVCIQKHTFTSHIFLQRYIVGY